MNKEKKIKLMFDNHNEVLRDVYYAQTGKDMYIFRHLFELTKPSYIHKDCFRIAYEYSKVKESDLFDIAANNGYNIATVSDYKGIITHIQFNK